ncbi:MAG TPA: hypothetical protein VMF61_15945 [Candidatus Acidoferrales bacterium]|nr:hypothetical protein [Candidatus Acidoferrales bacterium]
MNQPRIVVAAMAVISLAGGAIRPAWAIAAPYAQMAPLNRYLMPNRQREIDLARSAAPPSISRRATVLVLDAHGYSTAEEGTNGFTCVVERSWTKSFDDDNFWNPKVRAPVCYNAAASQSVLRYTVFRTALVLAGASEAQILARLKQAIAAGRLPTPPNGNVAYMMSKQGYIDDHVKAWYPHLMFYAPKSAGANAGESWGADRRGSPVVYDAGHAINPEPWACFFVPVGHWSDGSAGPPT